MRLGQGTEAETGDRIVAVTAVAGAGVPAEVAVDAVMDAEAAVVAVDVEATAAEGTKPLIYADQRRIRKPR